MKNIKLSTNPVLIHDENVHVIDFKLIYPVVFKPEYPIINNFLSHLLCESTALIPDETEFQREKLRKTVLEYSYYVNTLCDNMYIIFSFSLPMSGLISDYSLEESFSFVVDCLKNPIIKNKEADQEKFLHAKDFFIKRHDSAKQDIYGSNDIESKKIIDPDELLGMNYETYGECLNNITWDDLYEFYQRNIINNNFLVYVNGNIGEEEVNRLFAKYLPQDKDSIEISIEYFKLLPMAETKYHEIETKFNQAQLIMEYQVENMVEEDKIILSTIINILNASENNLIFDCLRVKNSLVYDAYVSSYTSYGMFTIEAFIDSSNKERVVELINEVMNSLYDEEKLSRCFEKLKEGYKVDLLKENDSLYKELNNRINNDLDIATIEKDYNRLLNLNVKDIIKFLDKIKLTNTILFKEANND